MAITRTWNTFTVEKTAGDNIDMLKIFMTATKESKSKSKEAVISLGAEGTEDKTLSSFTREKCEAVANAYADREGWDDLLEAEIDTEIAEEAKTTF